MTPCVNFRLVLTTRDSRSREQRRFRPLHYVRVCAPACRRMGRCLRSRPKLRGRRLQGRPKFDQLRHILRPTKRVAHTAGLRCRSRSKYRSKIRQDRSTAVDRRQWPTVRAIAPTTTTPSFTTGPDLVAASNMDRYTGRKSGGRISPLRGARQPKALSKRTRISASLTAKASTASTSFDKAYLW